MGVPDARAAWRGRPDRDGGRVDVEPVWQLRDGRRHQHRDQPARAPYRRTERAVREPQQPEFDFFGSDVWRNFGFAVEGSFFDTDGYLQVAEPERGPIDTNVTVEFRNFNTKVDYNPTSNVSTFVRVGYFSEERDNAKKVIFPNNADDSGGKRHELDGRERRRPHDPARLEQPAGARLWRRRDVPQQFPRGAEPYPPGMARVTLNQRVPTNGFGGMVQWSRALGTRNFLSVGTDWRWVDGDSEEDAMNATSTAVATHRVSGGTQRSYGAFIQDVFTPTDRLSLTMSLRVDDWKNYDGHNLETSSPLASPCPPVPAPAFLPAINRICRTGKTRRSARGAARCSGSPIA